MRGLIRRVLKEESDKQTDLANSNTTEHNICDDFSAESYEDLIQLINKSHVSKEDHGNIEKLLEMPKDMIPASITVLPSVEGVTNAVV